MWIPKGCCALVSKWLNKVWGLCRVLSLSFLNSQSKFPDNYFNKGKAEIQFNNVAGQTKKP